MSVDYNPNSILHSVKKIIGLSHDYTPFDDEIILHINSVLHRTTMLAIDDYMSISGPEDEWTDFIPDCSEIESVKTYVGLKVKKIFDPPSSSSVMQALNDTLGELEFMIYCQTNPSKGDITYE